VDWCNFKFSESHSSTPGPVFGEANEAPALGLAPKGALRLCR